jgi:hypothetical protein
VLNLLLFGAATVVRPIKRIVHPVRIIAGNIGFAMSYWLFADSYWCYRIQKKLFNAVFGCKTPVLDGPAFERGQTIIQGFRHSGNSFVISNIVEEDQWRVPKGLHRIWIIKEAIKQGLPVITLIRSPQDVVASTVYRTANSCDDPYAPFFLCPSAVLIAWIGYYRYVERFLDNLSIIPLHLLEDNYSVCVRSIADVTGLRMNELPSWERLNRYGGKRWEVRVSPFSRLLLRYAKARYSRLVKIAAQQA